MHSLDLIVIGAALLRVRGQAATGTFPATPLISKHFSYPSGLPFQADNETGLIRGTQSGYNKCNSSTEGPNSMCQTGFLNSLSDFCLFSAPKPDSMIADAEGETVAWCTQPGRGTRLIPQGALQGVQFMRTPDYVQVVGFIDQTQVDLQTGDFGGELDPNGADLRGNPIGGLMYSTAWSGNNNSFTQVIDWHNFMGSNTFCFKVCDPSKPNAPHYCEHIFDRIGCAYNAPNNATNGTFESCEGDDQDFPGVYTTNGQVMTFTQPPEGVVPSPPYTPKIPASSNCQTFSSASLFAAIASVIPTSGPFASGGASFSAGQSLASQAASASTAAGSASTGSSNDADAAVAGIASTLIGAIFAGLFLA